jgi:O-methyltransferase
MAGARRSAFRCPIWDATRVYPLLLASNCSSLDLSGDAPRLYLDLLKKCLTRVLFCDSSFSWDLHSTNPFDLGVRQDGKDWPTEAETMIGLNRLDNLQYCICDVLEKSVPGDLVETGVWRGGASILMRAVLEAYGDRRRQIWLADSFQGLPEPDGQQYPADAGDQHHSLSSYLAVSVEKVKANFARYALLDSRVHFLEGWFKDTLPSAPVDRIAVLRLDADMYESTIEALLYLYDKVSPGGFVIVDDYGALPNCRRAVDDFRTSRGICEPLITIDWTGVYWRKD